MHKVFPLMNLELLPELLAITERQINAQTASWEVIIRTEELSRWGKIPLCEAVNIAKNLRERGWKVFLEWDILMTEEELTKTIALFSTHSDLAYFEDFSAVRVQDVGAFYYMKQHFPQVPLHLILETGNHNLEALRKWCELAGGGLRRLILSREFSQHDFRYLQGKLPADLELEIQAFGRIPLFYSARALLTPVGIGKEVVGTSEESPHRGFRLIENRHGTFMFLPKELYLLDLENDLACLGLSHLRLELSSGEIGKQELVCFLRGDDLRQMGERAGKTYIRGLFNSNKTDALFKKLKNTKLKKDDNRYLGEVLEVIKGKMVAIHLKNPYLILKVGQEVEFITPEGRKISHRIIFLKSSTMEELAEARAPQIVYTNAVGRVTPRTIVHQQTILG